MKEINRRDFVKMTGAAAVGFALSQIPAEELRLPKLRLSAALMCRKLTVMALLQRCTLRSISMLSL